MMSDCEKRGVLVTLGCVWCGRPISARAYTFGTCDHCGEVWDDAEKGLENAREVGARLAGRLWEESLARIFGENGKYFIGG